LFVSGLEFLDLLGVTRGVALGKGVDHLLVLLDDEGDFGSGHWFEVLGEWEASPPPDAHSMAYQGLGGNPWASDDSVALAVVTDPAQGLSAGFFLAVLVDEVEGVDDLAVEVAIAEAADDDLLALAELALLNRVSEVVDLAAGLVCCGLGVLLKAQVGDHGAD
jgi:hypothetical protein